MDATEGVIQLDDRIGQTLGLYDSSKDRRPIKTSNVVDITALVPNPRGKVRLYYGKDSQGPLVVVQYCYPNYDFGSCLHFYYQRLSPSTTEIANRVGSWFDLSGFEMMQIIMANAQRKQGKKSKERVVPIGQRNVVVG